MWMPTFRTTALLALRLAPALQFNQRRAIMMQAGAFTAPLVVLSPAKSLDETSDFSAVPLSRAPFASETEALVAECRGLSQAQLKTLMSLSDPLAKLNHGRFQAFEEQPELPAAFAFDGPAHKAFDPATLSPEQLEYADHSIITLRF